MGYMCGRFAVTTDPALLAEKIQAIDESTRTAKKDAAGPNYNVAPTTTISTVVKRHTEPDDESTRRVRLMRWGLVPPWAKTAEDGGPDTKGPLLINARAEKVTTSPAFRNSAKNKRCLVPMDGWYEWRPNGDARARRRRRRRSTCTAPTASRCSWRGCGRRGGPKKSAPKDNPPLLSCTIITTDAAGPLAEIHDRMPLTISRDDWDRWLDPDAPIDEGLLRGHGDLDRIEIREVSRLVNSVRNNGPELIEPAKPEPEQATLL